VKWKVINKTRLKKIESKVISALLDCNEAIKLENKFGYAYYIRGQIKQIMNEPDYCLDLLTSKSFGVQVEVQLLSNCPN
jgi:hypothetical protein